MIGSFNSDELVKVLGLSANLKPQLVLALGEPDEKVVLVELPEDGKTAYYRKDNIYLRVASSREVHRRCASTFHPTRAALFT